MESDLETRIPLAGIKHNLLNIETLIPKKSPLPSDAIDFAHYLGRNLSKSVALSNFAKALAHQAGKYALQADGFERKGPENNPRYYDKDAAPYTKFKRQREIFVEVLMAHYLPKILAASCQPDYATEALLRMPKIWGRPV